MQNRLGFSGKLATTAMGIMHHEDVLSLARRLEGIWSLLEAKGADRSVIVRNSIHAPATCNLSNSDKTVTVENAFMLFGELSTYLKGKHL